MPFKCCVTGCRGNYKGEEKVSIFSFPKEELLKEKWIKCIPRKDFNWTKNSRVCQQHFKKDDLIWAATDFDEKTGRYLSVPLERPRLKAGVLPSIFPNCPSYLSSEAGPCRQSPRKRQQIAESSNIAKAIANSITSKNVYEESRTFSNFEELIVCNLKHKCSDFWNVIQNADVLMYLNLEKSLECVKLLYAVKVNTDLSLFVSFKGEMLSQLGRKYKKLPLKVTSITEIHEILEYIETLKNDSEQANVVTIDLINSLLRSIENEENTNQLENIMEQILLLNSKPQKRQYSPNTLIFASMFFLISPQAYRFVRQTNNFILPHPSTIHKITSKINASPQLELNDHLFLAYAKQKVLNLKEHELYVSLMMDEIHIKPFLDFKSGDLVGMAYESDEMASSAYVFMVQSILSTFKDVVHIFPAKKMTAEMLFDILRKIVLGLEVIGFKVIIVVSDNNSINRKCISSFNNSLSNFVFPHPADATRPLFYAVDTVHLIKSVRNNWINQKNNEQAMYFPNFDLSLNDVHTASFHTLKKLYEVESGDLLKYGYTLSRKALWPTNMERQNVKLALQVFNEIVSKSVTQLGEKHNLLNSQGTSLYLKIFSTWFTIMNVKTPYKGIHSRNDMCHPLTWDESNENIVFLKNFLEWLKKWGEMQSDTGRLTRETYSALILTTSSMLELTRYCITELNMSYLLPGKIQTDELEYRFSLYRRLAGTQYHISLRQVFEVENKLRACSVLKLLLISKSMGPVTIDDFSDTCDTSDIDKNVYENILIPYIEVTDNDIDSISGKIPLITYLAGYCCHSVIKRIKCESCSGNLVIEKPLIIHSDFQLIHNCDRGGLKYPAVDVVNIIMHNFIVLQKLIGTDFEREFLKVVNQRLFVLRATEEILISKEISITPCKQHSSTKIMTLLMRSATNTLLKNYCRFKNDSLPKLPNKRKLKTLTQDKR